MSTVNANINITVDNSQALGQIRALQSQISSFNKAAAAAGGAATAQMNALNKALADAAQASGMFNAKIVPTTAHIDRFSDSLDKGKLSLGQYARGIASQMPGARRVFEREFDTISRVAEERVKKLQTQYTALGNAQKALALQPTSLAMGDLATQTAMAAQKQMIMNKMISDGSTKLINWGKNTQWAGRQLMVGFTLPLTMFGATAAKVFMDLDRQTRDFKRVYGDVFTPPAEIEQNLKAVQDLAMEYTKYGVTVKDTMQVAATAAAAGMRNQELMDGTKEALRLATIGQIDYNQALDTTISLQTAFQMSNEELAPTVDFLGAVANQTVLTIDDMTKAIPRVAPVVKGLGGDVKDLAAMLVAMREGGVSAENAANGLKSGLASLINPTNTAQNALMKLGIDIRAIVAANRGDLMGTINEFATALSKLNDFERQQALEKTFGKYQYARLGALFDNIIAKGGQAEVALTLAGKSAEELGALSAKSLKEIEQSTTARFEGALERLKVSIAPIGESFLKALTPILEFIAKIADKFNNLPDVVKNVAMIMTVAIAGIGPIILMTVGLIANGIGNLIKFFQMIRKGFATIRGDASAFNYLAGAELDAAAAAASLEGRSEALTGALLMQEDVVQRLISLYQRLAQSANAAAQSMPTVLGGRMARGGRQRSNQPPLKMARGGIVPGSGSGDKVPALLEPGETVVTKEASQSYGPVIAAMNAGNLPGYKRGLNVPGSEGLDLVPAAGRRTSQAIQTFIDSISDLPDAMDRVKEVFQTFEKGSRITAKQFEEQAKAMGLQSLRESSGRSAAHLTKRRDISQEGMSWLEGRTGRREDGKSITAQNILAVAQDPETSAFVKEYSGLTADLSQTLNTQLQTGAAVADFNREWSEEGSRLLPSLQKFGGFVADSADDLDALNQFERELMQNVNNRADVMKDGIVKDSMLEEETQRLIQQYKNSNTSMGKIARAADLAANTIGQVSIQMSKEQAKKYATQIIDTENERRYLRNGAILGRESKETGRFRPERYGRLAKAAAQSYTSEMRDAILPQSDPANIIANQNPDRNSPNRVMPVIGKQDAKAYHTAQVKELERLRKSSGMSARERYYTSQSEERRRTADRAAMQKAGMSEAQMTRTERRLLESKIRQEKIKLAEMEKTAKLTQQSARIAQQTTQVAQQQQAALTNENAALRGRGRGGRVAAGLGIGSSLMSVGMMAPMLPGQAGEVGSALQPAIMVGSTLEMIIFSLMEFKDLLPAISMGFGSLAATIGIGVAAIAALTAAVIIGRNHVQDAFDKAAESGRKAAQSMSNVAKVGEAVGKSFRSLNVQKIGFQTQQKTQTQEYFATEQGIAETQRLSEQRASLGRNAFAQTLAQDVATAAITQGLSGKQIDAYISTVAEQLNDKGLYYQVRGELVELLDPANKEDILKNGLLIKVNAKTATEFLKEGMRIKPVDLKQLKAEVSDLFSVATYEGVQSTARSEADNVAEQLAKANQDYTRALNEGDYDKANELRNVIIPGLQTELALLENTVRENNIEMDGFINAAETASKAGAIFGAALAKNNQFLAQQKALLDSGQISQKQYNKRISDASKVAAQNAVSMKQVAKNLKSLPDPTAYTNFMQEISNQIFVGLDEELKKKIDEALASITDSAVAIDLQVAYAQGSITAQDLIDLSSNIQSLPAFARTDIIIAYGNGSLGLDELQYLNQNAAQLVGFDGSQIDFLIKLAGLQEMIKAIAIMQQINALGPITDANFSQYTALQNQLSDLQKDIPIDETGGDQGPDGGKTPKDRTGGAGKGEKTFKDDLLNQIKLYVDATATMKKLNDAKTNFVKEIAKGAGLLNKVAALPTIGTNPALMEYLSGLTPEALKDWMKKNTKRVGDKLSLSKEGKVLSRRVLEAGSGKSIFDAQQAANLSAMQGRAATSLTKRGLRTDVVEAISGDPKKAAEFLYLQRQANKGVKGGKQALDDFIKSQEQQIINEKELARLQDPLQAQIDDLTKAHEKVTKEIEKQKQPLEDQIDIYNKQIGELEKINSADQHRIDGLNHQKELIQRQIDAIEHQNELDQRRIDVLQRQDDIRNRVADALNHELDIMGQQEDKIRETHEKRTQALEKVRSINEQITKQQQDQLNISRALATGDIYEATSAAQQMQQNQVAFAQQQTSQALQQGMQNQISGLRTEGGLTRQQAEAQINAIKEQSYQTSLQIQVIEDAIYQRNLDILPLKDAIYNIEQQILPIQDAIYNREQQIYDIQNSKIDPLQQQIDQLDEQQKLADRVFESQIDNLEVLKAQKDMIDSQITSVNNLAQQWQSARDMVADINRLIRSRSDVVGGATVPSINVGETPTDYAQRLAGFKTSLEERIRKADEERKNREDAKKENKFAGGYMTKKYAAGNYVLGSGGRDSIPAMLTPGEFIIRKAAVDKYGVPMLNSLNMGAFRTGMPRYNLPDMFAGGTPRFNEAKGIQMDAPVYNNYNVNVNVAGTNASADEIATKAIMKIKEMQNMQIRGNRAY